jgi:S-formylglutathione hydrolase FrmB
MTLLPLLILLAASPDAAANAGEVRDAQFTSKSLGRDVAYAVHLPPSYAKGGGPYPVVYALHGLFESHDFWSRRGLSTLLEDRWAQKALPEFLVVAVDGGNSFFLNSRLGAFEDLVTQDAIAHVEATYRVRKGPAHRALLGISMGGYAALRVALAQPSVFGGVATHSAMLLTEPPTREAGARGGQMAAFEAVFGQPLDVETWRAQDPLRLAESAGRTGPRLYMDCGAQDRYGLAAGHRELSKRLTTRGVEHVVELPPGDHGYEYVRSRLAESLAFLSEPWKASAAKSASNTND